MEVTTRYDLEQLLAVANTRHGPGGHRRARPASDEVEHDHLADAVDARDFLASHDVPVPAAAPDEDELGALRRIQRAVRLLADEGDPRQALALAAPLFARARFAMEPDGELRAAGDGWARVVTDLLPPLLELVRTRDQLKVCGNESCRFLFLDRSRNRSRVWCETAVCGNRARVGRFRHRHAPGNASHPTEARARG